MLTRDFLLKAECKTAFGEVEASLLWTSEQRAASLAATLACRPDDAAIWIFGYGSLMWNPVFDADEIAPGTLDGWHRSFCLRLTVGRGTTAQPGRMLALREGGQTHGLAFCLPQARQQEELELLWKREMVTGCYLPTWCELRLDDGRTVTALVFVMDPRHPLYESDVCPRTVAPLIAQASGPLGSNAQYLFNLEQELQRRGMQDDCIRDLVQQVRDIQQHPG
ncbi:gamma-glutamylcyclotransferase [Erwinia sp. OLTSP20]|uniref:gamma-glutamylcyclotransferase n=1 Tax=unclassified Erwinia TaxID=2622719 RepID=UPI000C174E60|nr:MULTISPECIES: gamma-glutamylcyclotransferase [unclassified Erwinia]PIJ49971.1 gamma-glutamylcyclotransferase [Erwinia sp. OAMSP11]PIJ71381.1 gamma-glutamylcyclotransferase [Erwinia sp. OLSSP12]PIJ80616.1 gamma-glutamylcyclotransferase [Erwinia sp. OLCASP19]PIJ82788.1 gamma-glutamylcyclotransferase [Erwinia sp. OLMTSP26]PIJ85473.1 gamma-glutamylcyclotransferase [Erwinia sp. OLMDSP33]